MVLLLIMAPILLLMFLDIYVYLAFKCLGLSMVDEGKSKKALLTHKIYSVILVYSLL